MACSYLEGHDPLAGSGDNRNGDVDSPIGTSVVSDRATSFADQLRSHTEDGQGTIRSPEELAMQRR